MRQKTFPNYIITLIIVAKFVLEYLLVSPIYELHRDEFLHLDQANHLDWGYPSVPPVSSWIALLIKFLGNGVFWVKFFPALFGAITIWIVWKTVKVLEGTLLAAILATLSVLFSGLLRINILFQPNSLDILCYTLVFYFVIAYIKKEKISLLYYLGITIGFGMLNKYNLIFLILALSAALLLTPQRKILANKHLWGALLVAFLVFLPNLIWQIKHQFPVVWHLNELEKTQLVNVNRSDFIAEQFKFFFGAFFIWLIGLFVLLFYRPFKNYQIIGLTYLFTISLFIYLHAKGYYAIGLYPILFAFGSIFIDQKLATKKWQLALSFSIISINILLFILFMDLAFPIKSPQKLAANGEKLKELGMLRWEDGKDHQLPQDFADMLGWKEMAKKADATFELIPIKERVNTLVIGDNYGQTGAVNYYSKNIRNAVTYSFDYINWFPKLDKLQHIVLVGEQPDDTILRHFKSLKKTGEVDNSYAREKGTGIYLLSYPDKAAIQMLKLRLDKFKAQF
ncbi:glycosyltransferase family 39 protein [Pelobium sp.]|nr:glycosyltransferase family 39 protein [Pelobium sp.]MDA9555191.1 glycosyltransferase family 39 protein [Pelobium sp.]